MPEARMTARADGVDRIIGLEQGADDYLAKPFLPRELTARIEAVLRRRNAMPAGTPVEGGRPLWRQPTGSQPPAPCETSGLLAPL